jgi:adenylate cyclase
MSSADTNDEREVTLRDLRRCFDGRIPAVIATASADGTPNVTYLSAVHRIDDDRIALSNQFLSKTSHNLSENPQASLVLMDPVNFDEYRLAIRYERTERRGPVFDRLREDVDRIAALGSMKDVFRLRSADIYRIESIETVFASKIPAPKQRAELAAVAELTARLSRCRDLDAVVSATVAGLAELLGYRHSSFLMLDELGKTLFTIASHGFEVQGIGSEIAVGEGVVGLAAARCEAVRVGQLRQIEKYSRSVRRSFENEGHIGPGLEIPVPELVDVESRLAVPAQALGQLVGVLVVESPVPVAFDEDDEAALRMIASMVANAVELDRVSDESTARAAAPSVSAVEAATSASVLVRFFAVDGSVFLDGDYLIRGVAGRILWSVLNQYQADGRVEFTNKEVRLDPTLDLPGFRDNLDTRLILLKRRLEERGAAIRIEKTGRGRFRLQVGATLRLDSQT